MNKFKVGDIVELVMPIMDAGGYSNGIPRDRWKLFVNRKLKIDKISSSNKIWLRVADTGAIVGSVNGIQYHWETQHLKLCKPKKIKKVTYWK